MKRLAFTISLILVVVLALSFFYVSRVASAKPIPPSVQMLSTSNLSVSITPGPVTVVETLSFSVTAPAKLEATSEIEASGNTVTCVIGLDGVAIAGPTGFSFSPDLTGTATSVAVGSHTLVVFCSIVGLTTATASGTLSAIITTGL